MKNSEIVIGSRGSDLALWQANYIKDLLEKEGHSVRIEIIETHGDINQNLSFQQMEGKGFFTGELETALLENKIDLAVHSFKDLDAVQPPELAISAILNRANPADMLLIRKDATDQNETWGLKKSARVGTSSARRKMQIHHNRPDVETLDIRGSVPARVKKLRDGMYDAIVLAKAGLDRLNLNISDLESYEFDPREFIPAPAQGALACQTRADDSDLIEILKAIHNKKVGDLVSTERKVLSLFDGGDELPIGAFCEETDTGIELRVIMLATDEDQPKRVLITAQTTNGLAEKAVAELKKKVPA